MKLLSDREERKRDKERTRKGKGKRGREEGRKTKMYPFQQKLNKMRLGSQT